MPGNHFFSEIFEIWENPEIVPVRAKISSLKKGRFLAKFDRFLALFAVFWEIWRNLGIFLNFPEISGISLPRPGRDLGNA